MPVILDYIPVYIFISKSKWSSISPPERAFLCRQQQYIAALDSQSGEEEEEEVEEEEAISMMSLAKAM